MAQLRRQRHHDLVDTLRQSETRSRQIQLSLELARIETLRRGHVANKGRCKDAELRVGTCLPVMTAGGSAASDELRRLRHESPPPAAGHRPPRRGFWPPALRLLR
jgi:hypothetical protein